LRTGWAFGTLALVSFGITTWQIATTIGECSDECHRFAIFWLAAAFVALAGLIVLLGTLDLQLTGRVHKVVRILASVIFVVSPFLIGWALLGSGWFLIVRDDPATVGLYLLVFGLPAAVGTLAFFLIRRLASGPHGTYRPDGRL
jgi:hypothetical protein